MPEPAFLDAQRKIFDVLEGLEEDHGYDTAKDALEAVHRGYDQPLNTHRGSSDGGVDA